MIAKFKTVESVAGVYVKNAGNKKALYLRKHPESLKEDRIRNAGVSVVYPSQWLEIARINVHFNSYAKHIKFSSTQ